MEGMRELEAYCETCGEPTPHVATADDPGTCRCKECGTLQVLMVPID